MTNIKHSVVIDRTPDEVWDYVHDLANDPAWQPSVLRSHQLTDGPFGSGTKIVEDRRFLGKRFKTAYEVTEYEPKRRSAVATTSGPIPARGFYAFEPTDGATRFTVGLETEAHGFFKLAEPVFARMARREIRANLGNLKDLLEAGSSTSAE
jgi:uncharacterized membrane protein